LDLDLVSKPPTSAAGLRAGRRELIQPARYRRPDRG